MSNKNLVGRTLKAIYDYWRIHDRSYPTSREIANAVGISISHWGNLRKILFQRRLIKKSDIWQFEFTDVAFRALVTNDRLDKAPSKPRNKISRKGNFEKEKSLDEILSEPTIELPLYGAVRAGAGSTPEDLKRYTGDETIAVFADEDLNPEKVFVMEVEGESMIHEGIYPGDLVIVKKTSITQINDGDLIVATYLSEAFNKKKQEVVDDARNDPSNFNGPTLKYFHTDYFGKKELVYRLSWKTQAKQSEFKIFTRYLSPEELGKVIAVYTPSRYRKIIRPKKSK